MRIKNIKNIFKYLFKIMKFYIKRIAKDVFKMEV